jgi:UPF0755 protein
MAEGARVPRPRAARVLLLGLLAVLLLGAASLGLGYMWLQRNFQAPGPGATAARITVNPGASLRSVLVQLEAARRVRSARAIGWYLRLRGERPRVQAGMYEIPPHASPAQVLALLEQGKVILEQLTVVEGSTFAEFVSALERNPDVVHTLRDKTPAEVMAALGHPGQFPEGEFFPDTYRFAAGTPDIVILARAYDAMQSALEAAWKARQPGLPYESPYQALILASMVEKEAALKSERALIAGVFLNRLRRDMRLQSDPTVIYGLGADYDGTIHTRDLLRDTPYNTYTREGLPPTPIALPGRESLTAAVQPQETAALYFVATGLGDGAHHFSNTLEEHNSAVQSYLVRLREQERRAQRKPPLTPDAAATEGASAPAPAPVKAPSGSPSGQGVHRP